MPHLIPDDKQRRIRAVWLGPRGITWKWEWTYSQWITTLAMTAVGFLLFYQLFGAFFTGGERILVAFAAGAGLGTQFGVWVARKASFDQPIYFLAAQAWSEFRNLGRKPEGERRTRLTFPPITETPTTTPKEHTDDNRPRRDAAPRRAA